jgi:hypothetical protein
MIKNNATLKWAVERLKAYAPSGYESYDDEWSIGYVDGYHSAIADLESLIEDEV